MTTHSSLNFDIDRPNSYKDIPQKIAHVTETVSAIKHVPPAERTFDNTAGRLIKASKELEDLWGLLSHYQKVLNDESLRATHSDMQQKLTELDNTLTFDAELMKLYEELIQQPQLSDDQKLFLEYEIKDFQLCGLSCPADVQKRLKDIRLELSELSLTFQNNVMDSTYQWVSTLEPHELEGLPEAVQNYFKQIFEEYQESLTEKYGSLPEFPYAINLSHPCVQPILGHSPCRSLRERVFKALQAQCGPFDEVAARFNNTETVAKILCLRQESARLLGYASYQEMKLENRFARSPSDIEGLYEKAIALLKPAAESEYAEIVALAQSEDQINELEPWDVGYYTQLWRKHHLNMDPEELRSFFPLERVLHTMLEIFEGVFDLKITTNQQSAGWHPDVFSLEISENDQFLGTIYCDLFARSQKDQGAWMNDQQGAYLNDLGHWEPAVAYLCCNFRPGNPAELLFEEVLTLFHEFGHCLHHILSRRTVEPISGLSRVPWDIVELPSQLFEKWCYQPEWIEKMSTDPKTGQSLPEEKIQALIKAKTILSGLFYLRQIQLGYFDWHLHGPGDQQPVRFWHDVLQKISVTPRYADSQFPLSFGHIFGGGYSAGYYSYLWADLYVAQCFERFGQYDSMTEAGRDFRQFFLGLSAPWDLKEQLENNFLKEPQKIEPFIRSLGYDSLLKKD